MFDIPVLLIVFNRPDLAHQVISAVKKVKPARIYLAADGPRANREGESDICQETRNCILNEIDWDCQIHTLFQEKNMGCALAVSGAINWFFEHEEMGIILEDDCVAGESFFQFCSQLLTKYKNDDRIMQISGYNDQDNKIRGNASYYFSKFPTGWGWATWKRAWMHNDFEVKKLDTEFNKIIKNTFYGNRKAANRWLKLLINNLDSTWDYQWAYSIFLKDGLCISPNVSLVKNIGFDERSTHTVKVLPGNQAIEAGSIEKITHPEIVSANLQADRLTMSKRYYTPLFERIYNKTANLFH